MLCGGARSDESANCRLLLWKVLNLFWFRGWPSLAGRLCVVDASLAGTAAQLGWPVLGSWLPSLAGWLGFVGASLAGTSAQLGWPVLLSWGRPSLAGRLGFVGASLAGTSAQLGWPVLGSGLVQLSWMAQFCCCQLSWHPGAAWLAWCDLSWLSFGGSGGRYSWMRSRYDDVGRFPGSQFGSSFQTH